MLTSPVFVICSTAVELFLTILLIRAQVISIKAKGKAPLDERFRELDKRLKSIEARMSELDSLITRDNNARWSENDKKWAAFDRFIDGSEAFQEIMLSAVDALIASTPGQSGSDFMKKYTEYKNARRIAHNRPNS